MKHAHRTVWGLVAFMAIVLARCQSLPLDNNVLGPGLDTEGKSVSRRRQVGAVQVVPIGPVGLGR